MGCLNARRRADLSSSSASSGHALYGPLQRFFRRPGLTRKKDCACQRAGSPDVLRKRWFWFEGQPDLHPARPMFINESWAKPNMARTHGRRRRGAGLRMGMPHGHWKTTTFMAGLSTRGPVAPFMLSGLINRAAIQAYLERVLVPTLRAGGIVVMGNLLSHKGPGPKSLIDAAEAQLLVLPPNSPDFNPIENVLLKLKALLRKAADRTVDGL